MGRVKIEIKFLEHRPTRTATFRKRSAGLQKKAHELHTLCGAKIKLEMVPLEGQTREYDSRHKERYLANLRNKGKRNNPSTPQAIANHATNKDDGNEGDKGYEEYDSPDDLKSDESVRIDDIPAALNSDPSQASDYQDENFHGHLYHDEGEDMKFCCSDHLEGLPQQFQASCSLAAHGYDIEHPHGTCDGATNLPLPFPVPAVPLGARFPSNYNMTAAEVPVKVEELAFPEVPGKVDDHPFFLTEEDYVVLFNSMQ